MSGPHDTTPLQPPPTSSPPPAGEGEGGGKPTSRYLPLVLLPGLVNGPSEGGGNPAPWYLPPPPGDRTRRPAGRRLSLLLLLLILAGLAAPAGAQAPERQRRFVWGFYTYQGSQYATGFVPPSVETIYVLADHQGILDPKLTEVYFWPITNEFRADFAALNQRVPGTLEVSQGGRAIATHSLTDYIIQVDQAKEYEGERLSIGEAARASRVEFDRQRVAFVEATNAYARAQEEYLRRIQAGEKPTAPPQPAPFTLFSTDLNQGFALTLPAGDYTIRLRDESGALVPDSERRLVAITPRRQGVGYEVVPQERWTFPEELHDPSNVIYTSPDGIVFLRPFATLEFNALEHARLIRPQDRAATPNRWVWVPTAPLETATLVTASDGAAEQRQVLASYVVEQLSGPALGYAIKPAPDAAQLDPGAPAPDLRNYYRLSAPPGQRTLRFRLVDAQGQPLAGSERELIVSTPAPDWLLAVPVLLPLAIGLALLLWRRRQILTARSLRPEQRQRMA